MSRYVNNPEGWRKLFTSDAMRAKCLEAAWMVANDANAKALASSKRLSKSGIEPYKASADVHSNTAVGHVRINKQFAGIEAAHGFIKGYTS